MTIKEFHIFYFSPTYTIKDLIGQSGYDVRSLIRSLEINKKDELMKCWSLQREDWIYVSVKLGNIERNTLWIMD